MNFLQKGIISCILGVQLSAGIRKKFVVYEKLADLWGAECRYLLQLAALPQAGAPGGGKVGKRSEVITNYLKIANGDVRVVLKGNRGAGVASLFFAGQPIFQ